MIRDCVMIECKEHAMVNEKVIQRFELLIRRERLAHAYLFIGSKGCGKSQTALEVAKMVNCESRPVMSTLCECDSCRKIDSGNHPDIVIVDKGDDQSIKIHKVRDLIQNVQLLPYEAGKKVVIIKDIDCLTSEGANALLKTLEEPPSSSLFILTTSAAERVFETIRSRCHSVYFFGNSRQRTVDHLKKQSGFSGEQGWTIAGFSDGCFEKACRMQQENFMVFKNEVIDQFLIKGADDRFLKTISADSERAGHILEVLIFCFKDMLLLKTGVSPQQLTNNDRREELTTYSARYSTEQLRDVLKAVVNAKKTLDAGLSIKIPLMLLKEKIWSIN